MIRIYIGKSNKEAEDLLRLFQGKEIKITGRLVNGIDGLYLFINHVEEVDM